MTSTGRRFEVFSQKVFRHRYGFTMFAFLAPPTATGVACVLFMWAFDFVFSHRLDFRRIGPACWVTTPLLFLLAVWLIRRWAPWAEGTGIPQTIFASRNLTDVNQKSVLPLVSVRTMSVKVGSLLIALWAGASTGREGPTVHVATCLFVGIILFLRRWTRLTLDLRSAVIAGGAAGLAAAFNTPLAGVTFAVEELSSDYFAGIKDFVLMAIIVAGLTAKSLIGEYAYFGRLTAPSPMPLAATLLIGLLAGGLGAGFTSTLLWGKDRLSRFRAGKRWVLVPLLLALAFLAVAAVSPATVMGPGNTIAKIFVRGHYAEWAPLYFFSKAAATLLTYWSGIAGGIFAPCLTMGSALGAAFGRFLSAPVEACALIGMAAFLSGAIQAPITAFVIIFEMTGHHQMLLPIMLASLLAFMVARISGAKHFYQLLADSYGGILPAK